MQAKYAAKAADDITSKFRSAKDDVVVKPQTNATPAPVKTSPLSARAMDVKGNTEGDAISALGGTKNDVPATKPASVSPPDLSTRSGEAITAQVKAAAAKPTPANVPTPPPRPAAPAPAARPAPAAAPTPQTPAQSFAARNTDAAIKRSDWYTGAGGGQ
jgi:hypothetical protein